MSGYSIEIRPLGAGSFVVKLAGVPVGVIERVGRHAWYADGALYESARRAAAVLAGEA